LVFWLWVSIGVLAVPFIAFGLVLALHLGLRPYTAQSELFTREKNPPRRSMWWGRGRF